MATVLAGHSPEERIVAVQQFGDKHVRLYVRENGKTTYREEEFFPFFFLTDQSLLSGIKSEHWLRKLDGDNAYRYLAVFTRWSDYWDALRLALVNYNKSGFPKADSFLSVNSLLTRSDPVTQYLMQSGKCLFNGMTFDDLRRLQIEISTHTSGRRRSNPRRSDDRILRIALTDGDWESVLEGEKLSEKELLEHLQDIITERDPDVIESYDLFGFTLPYLLIRSEVNAVRLEIGRDGTEPKSLPVRGVAGDRESERGLYGLAGRHLLDIRTLVHAYDYSRRSIEQDDLVSVAHHLGFSIPAENPEAAPTRKGKRQPPDLAFRTQALRHVSTCLSPSYFYLTQLCPLSYGTVTRTGSATKIELLMMREYLRQKHSLPKPVEGTQMTGGYADIFRIGVLSDVLYADVESLYPSIMIQHQIEPSRDSLHVFHELLKGLLERRLRAKNSALEATNPADRATLDAMQSAYKILVNSFYGYLGYARALFNDFDKADEVTRTGQELLKAIIKEVELHNGEVIEADTDGVFFTLPDNVRGKENQEAFITRISETLPSGIRLAPVGTYRKMLSYRKKNYALLGYDNSLIIRGSSLISRSMEGFARTFIREAIQDILEADIAGLHALYSQYARDIVSHRLRVADFARTEVVHDAPDVYEREVEGGSRNPSGLYEAAKRSGLLLSPGDRVSYYVTGSGTGVTIYENSRIAEEWDPNFPDENTAYYLSRLEECCRKFEDFFTPEDYTKVFSQEGLFGFEPGTITILTKEIESPLEEKHAPRSEETPTPGIWLDLDNQ